MVVPLERESAWTKYVPQSTACTGAYSTPALHLHESLFNMFNE